MARDLEIEIRAGATPGTYDVEVDSPAGTATGTMRLDAASILSRRRDLASSVLASSVTSRSTFSTTEAPVREVGNALFEALFAERVYGRYTASLQQAISQGEPLRVVLRLRAQELAAIPWESLYDPETGEYLCQREPVVRFVEAAQPSAPLVATGPLRILGMIAAPQDLPELDTAEERRRLDDALGELQEQGLVDMVWVESGTWEALQQQLIDGPWHVLHFVGHGGVSAKKGVLALEDEKTGKAKMVGAARFSRLLHACRPVPRLVVLNSCSSGESAADDLLSSMASSLVHSGTTATVAMQFAVTDPAALAFSRGFYQAMARNIPVDEAVRLGRIAIDGTSEQTLEWVTPVLYLRTDDTRLFQLTAGEKQSATAMPEEGEEISREAAKYGLYVQALAAARKGKYDEAAALFDSLSTLDPSYRDATVRRDRVRRAQRIESEYEAAKAAEAAGDWEGALGGYRAVLDLDPNHRDALRGHDVAELQRDIASLKDELHIHADQEDWAAVLAVSEDLRKLDPAAADPDGLATRAREALAQTAGAGDLKTRTVPPVGHGEAPPTQPVPQPKEEAPQPQPVPQHQQAPPQPPETQPLPMQPPQPPAPEQPPEQPKEEQPPPPQPPPPSPPQPRPIDFPDPTNDDDDDDDERRRQRLKQIWWSLAVGAALVAVVTAGGFWNATREQTDAGSDADAPAAGQVQCWDGSAADTPSGCPLPEGAEGLASVYPSMNEDCEEKDPSAPGKVELFECVFDTFTVRYSRWDQDVDRFAFFDRNISGAQTDVWTVDGVPAGRQWIGLDDRESEERRFRWIAAYESAPYDVTVKGIDEGALQEGIQSVIAKKPEEIGLP